MDLLIALLAAIIGYLVGSISFARLVSRQFAPQQDISKIVVEGVDGEGRFESDAVSATSVRLHLGPAYGCLAGILDILKAAIPALVFKLWMPDTPYYLLAAGMAVVGHNWPVYYRFHGGRGISPSMGGMLVVDWPGLSLRTFWAWSATWSSGIRSSPPESGWGSWSPGSGLAPTAGLSESIR